MEHPFLSRRSILDTSKNITDLAKDVLIILSSTADEHTAIKERREPEIKNETLKEALTRRAGRLGLLIEDLKLDNSDVKCWSRFLRDHTVDVMELKKNLSVKIQESEELASSLRHTELQEDASSSSDYSDSDTSSSSSSKKRPSFSRRNIDESEETEDDESEEEEEEEPSPPPVVHRKKRGKGNK